MLEDASALVPDGKFAFVTHGKVKRHLKLTRIPQFSGDPGGAYVVPPIILDRALAHMLGHPIFTTAQIRTNLTKGSGSNLSEVYCGNFADLLIGVWGNLEILATECRRQCVGTEPHGDPHDPFAPCIWAADSDGAVCPRLCNRAV